MSLGSGFLARAVRLGRLIISHGFGGNAVPPAVEGPVCITAGAPTALYAITPGLPIPLLALSPGAPSLTLAIKPGPIEVC